VGSTLRMFSVAMGTPLLSRTGGNPKNRNSTLNVPADADQRFYDRPGSRQMQGRPPLTSGPLSRSQQTLAPWHPFLGVLEGCLTPSLSHRIVAESETASQACLQSRLGRRTALEARPPRHGAAVDQTADPRMVQAPRPGASVGAFGVVRGKKKKTLLLDHWEPSGYPE